MTSKECLNLVARYWHSLIAGFSPQAVMDAVSTASRVDGGEICHPSWNRNFAIIPEGLGQQGWRGSAMN